MHDLCELLLNFHLLLSFSYFQLTETVREAVHFGPNRVSFRPFLFVEAGGLAVDIFLHGRNYLDVQFGMTHISVSSQGRCACDAKEPEDLRVSHSFFICHIFFFVYFFFCLIFIFVLIFIYCHYNI